MALQTHETLEKIGTPFGIKSVCVFGGVSKGQQKSLLSNPAVRVLVGTPGRLLDLVNEGACDLSGQVIILCCHLPFACSFIHQGILFSSG